MSRDKGATTTGRTSLNEKFDLQLASIRLSLYASYLTIHAKPLLNIFISS